MMKFWQTYGVHTISYLLGALPVVQALAPTLIPGYGIAIAAAAGVALTVVHNVQTATASSAPVSVSPTAKSLLLPLVCLTLGLAAAGGMSGCATISKLTAPNAAPYVTAAVDVAVATAEQNGVSAAQINSIAKKALAADSGTAATLSTVATVVNAELVKLKLPAGDLAAANILEATLSVAIQAQVGSNPNIATAQAAIADVLKAVITATGG